jgi:hypothetical protein
MTDFSFPDKRDSSVNVTKLTDSIANITGIVTTNQIPTTAIILFFFLQCFFDFVIDKTAQITIAVVIAPTVEITEKTFWAANVEMLLRPCYRNIK